MAKTRLVGNDGTISTGVFSQSSDNATHNAIINYYTVSFPRVATNVTGFNDNIEHNRLGITRIEGSLRGSTLNGATSTSPGVADRTAGGSSMTLLVATGCTYAFTAAFLNMTFNVEKQGGSEFQTDFLNGDSDTLTETWQES